LIRKPFVADCYFNIQDGFQQIHFRCIGPPWPTFQLKQSLPDDLVPSIAKDQLDDVARTLLKDLYPNALKNASRTCRERCPQDWAQCALRWA
jgi:hypothetical protein